MRFVALMMVTLCAMQAESEGSTYYFPHLAVGAGWQTTLTYVNYSAEEVSCRTDFLSDQGTPLMVSFPSLGPDTSRSDMLPPGGSVHEETDVGLSAPPAAGWARATCTGPVKASLLFRQYDSAGVPLAEAGVNAAAIPATRFVTFAEQAPGQAGTGVAYANPSDTAAVVTFTARDEAGRTLDSVDRTLMPGGHGAQNMAGLFDLSSFTGSLEITSSEPIVTLSINAEAAPIFSSLPPGELDPSAQGPTTYYFPHLAVGTSWQTTLTYINYSPQEVTCRTDFFSGQGTPLTVSFPGGGRGSSRTDVLPPGGSVHEETDVGLSAPLVSGWARADCMGPVKASLLFRQYDSAGVPLAEAGVNAAAVAASRFVTFAEQAPGQAGTAIAYANPSDTSTAMVTFTAKDEAGRTLASVDQTLMPGGHGAQNMGGLFSLTSFKGSLEITSSKPIVTLSINTEAAPVFSSLPPGELDPSPRVAPTTDREVLEAFYHLTGGPNWRVRTNWLSDAPLGAWFGVVADGNGRVTSLDLPRNGLSGTIPPELGGLANLKILDLDNNELSGGLPPELGGLANLRFLDLDGNELSGGLPPELGRLANLLGLYLGNSKLSGAIPPELGGLANLERLGLRGNKLSGKIPQSLMQLSKLTTLDISNTDVCVPTGAEFQAWLATISTFRTSGIDCDGTFRISFSASSYVVREGGSVEVTVRSIDQTEGPAHSAMIELTVAPGGGATAADYAGAPESVTITAPATEASFFVTAVEDRHFDHAETIKFGFRRPLPPPVTAGDPDTAAVTIIDPGTVLVTDREVLEALYEATGGPGWIERENWLSEAPLGEWFGVVADGNGRVTSLNLPGNGLRGVVPPALGRLASLEQLNLGSVWDPEKRQWINNELSGAIPPELGRLANLQFLDLRRNELSGEIPPELGGLGNLQFLNLFGNELSGAIPPGLGRLGNLQRLYLGANELSGEIPPGLGGLANLDRLDLGYNKLSGAIPPELGELTNLERLDLRGNELSGAIPPELGELTNLERLLLRDNWLSGAIPPELGELTNLEQLYLGDNKPRHPAVGGLSGEIPPELGGLANLQILDLRVNKLSGEIPPGLGELTNLERLYLRDNRLSGEIPPELGGLANLQILDLRDNKLSGAVPPELGGLANLRGLFLRDNMLSGAIPPELGSLANLRSLDLRGNELSGEILPELGGLANLGGLYLGGNKLSGAVPPELGSLANLRGLDLGFNQELSGTIPPGMRHLPLSTLSLMATSACAPQEAEFQEWLKTIEFLPSGLCGGPVAAISEIDIAVFYTPAARRMAGGTAGIETLIDLRVAETNQAYEDSGVNQRLVLVAREEVQYVEVSRSLGLAMARLIDPSDGYMDEVHEIRDRAGADLVHLMDELVDSTGRPNAAGQLPGSFSAGGPCVHCSSGGFAHELGHNMGLSHDRYESPSSPTFPYSHGYVNQRAFETGAPRSSRWRTIMAYQDQCSDAGFVCNRLMRFSNPNQTYLGDPLGVTGNERTAAVDGPADAVRTLNITRHSVAAFRARLQDAISRAPSGGKQAALPANAAGGRGGVLFRAVAPKAGIPAETDAKALRRREVRVDIGLLNRASAESNPALTMNLFDDVTVIGLIERRTPTYSGGHALTGRLLGIPGGTMALVVNGDAVAGAVRLPGAAYRIRPAGAGRHAIIKVDPSQTSWSCGTGEQTR